MRLWRLACMVCAEKAVNDNSHAVSFTFLVNTIHVAFDSHSMVRQSPVVPKATRHPGCAHANAPNAFTSKILRAASKSISIMGLYTGETTNVATSQHWYVLAIVALVRCRGAVVDGKTSSRATIKTVFPLGVRDRSIRNGAERVLAIDLAGRRGHYRVE